MQKTEENFIFLFNDFNQWESTPVLCIQNHLDTLRRQLYRTPLYLFCFCVRYWTTRVKNRRSRSLLARMETEIERKRNWWTIKTMTSTVSYVQHCVASSRVLFTCFVWLIALNHPPHHSLPAFHCRENRCVSRQRGGLARAEKATQRDRGPLRHPLRHPHARPTSATTSAVIFTVSDTAFATTLAIFDSRVSGEKQTSFSTATPFCSSPRLHLYLHCCLLTVVQQASDLSVKCWLLRRRRRLVRNRLQG